MLEDIRAEIWLKVWGSLSFNPISALTHATLVDLCQYPLARELARDMMLEAQAVANKLGTQLRVTIDRRIDGAERVGTPQDVHAPGRRGGRVTPRSTRSSARSSSSAASPKYRRRTSPRSMRA